MKKDIALKIDNVSKQYRLGLTGTGTLSHDLNRWWCKIRGKEDPYAKVGEVNDRSVEGGEYVWAIKDINIEVKKGEILGIIGKNGAGKSTLLKILSRITGPTTGEITMNGRMASLLEVGTGFHPELTGRENIFLNGAILGMTKKEINDKLNDIIEFSGCAKYVDTPVKRYSSGMRVRLGFAVAAFLEPDILIVDEVLAVGDADFQRKAIGKMKEISAGGKRTVLFVSHNMAAVKSLCTRAIVLENGEIGYSGSAKESVEYYINGNNVKSTNHLLLNENSIESDINLIEIKLSPQTGNYISIESGINVMIKFENKKRNCTLTSSIVVFDQEEIRLFEAPCFFAPEQDSKNGIYTLNGIIPPYLLNSGKYKIMFVVGEAQKYVVYLKEDLIYFDIEDTPFNKGISLNRPAGILRPKIEWNIKYEN